jgi:uncharacterized protein YybS (DUF2232 family)
MQALLDLIYIGFVIGSLQLPRYWRKVPGGEFIIAHAPLVVWAFSVILTLSYTVASSHSAGAPTFPRKTIRAIILFLIANAINFWIYRQENPTESFEISFQGALYLVVGPCVLFACIAGSMGELIATRFARRGRKPLLSL